MKLHQSSFALHHKKMIYHIIGMITPIKILIFILFNFPYTRFLFIFYGQFVFS